MRFFDGRFTFAVAIAALCGPIATQAPAQDGRPLSFGYEGLRIMLEQHGLEPVAEMQRWRSLPPAQTVVVVMGRTAELDANVGSLSAYARKGGGVLAASDHAGRDLGIAIGQGPVMVDDATLAYRDYADCPLVTRFQQEHPLFRNVTRLATNRPGYFAREGSTSTFLPLAWFPAESRVQDRPLGALPLIAYRTFPRGGRVVVAADHSLFTNQMLLAEDNLLFAWNCASWLCDSGERKYVLFLEDGRPAGRVDVSSLLSRARPSLGSNVPSTAAELPREAAADLPPASLVVFANALIAGLEDEDVFNALAERQPRGVHALVFRRGALLAATIVLVAAGAAIVLLGRGDRSSRTSGPPHAAEGAAADVLLPPGEAAGMLAWHFFGGAGSDLADRPGGARPTPPLVEVLGGPLHRWRVRRRVMRLWRIATRPTGTRLSPRRLNQVAAEVIALRHMEAEWQLRMSFEPESSRRPVDETESLAHMVKPRVS